VEPKTQLEKHEILQIQDLVRRVPVASPVIHYALELVRCTRPHQQESDYLRKNGESGRTANPAADIIDRMVSFGAGPRAVQNLLVGAKAWALIQGRNHVAIEDIRDLARPVLRHRIITNYTADAEGRTSDDIVNLLMERLSSRHVTEGADGDFAQVLRS
ncbi:MAG: AAA family ATPase, partial [Phycisphaerae bacterium]